MNNYGYTPSPRGAQVVAQQQAQLAQQQAQLVQQQNSAAIRQQYLQPDPVLGNLQQLARLAGPQVQQPAGLAGPQVQQPLGSIAAGGGLSPQQYADLQQQAALMQAMSMNPSQFPNAPSQTLTPAMIASAPPGADMAAARAAPAPVGPPQMQQPAYNMLGAGTYQAPPQRAPTRGAAFNNLRSKYGMV